MKTTDSVPLLSLKDSRDRAITVSLGEDLRFPMQNLEFEDCALVVVEGPHQGLTFPFFKDMIDIGRRTELCDMVLDKDNGISGLHARLQIEPDADGNLAVLVRDLKSRNGTFVNGARIREAYLTQEYRLQVGKSVILFKTNSADKKNLTIHFYDQSGTLVGASPHMRRIFTMLSRLGQRNVTVMLTGETGTGKSSIAQALHLQSNRKSGPFISVNCGALPPSLIESSLFGHEKGAFTGANSRHQGFFEQADTGTLFLDEIGEIPIELQAKFLDVIERKCITRLGSNKEIPVDFRLICATNRDLKHEIKEGGFREDLYYRLSVIQVEVPPLRERHEDIPLLIDRILQDLFPNTPYKLTEAALHRLVNYLWPGNVRQLRNVLERTFTFIDHDIADIKDLELPEISGQEDTKEPIRPLPRSTQTAVASIPWEQNISISPQGNSLKDMLAHFEQRVIEHALQTTDWNIAQTAEALDIAQSWLYKRIKKFNLQRKS